MLKCQQKIKNKNLRFSNPIAINITQSRYLYFSYFSKGEMTKLTKRNMQEKCSFISIGNKSLLCSFSKSCRGSSLTFIFLLLS